MFSRSNRRPHRPHRSLMMILVLMGISVATGYGLRQSDAAPLRVIPALHQWVPIPAAMRLLRPHELWWLPSTLQISLAQPRLLPMIWPRLSAMPSR